ncbi:SMP-30/gluconolactonase/LRE family protein [Mycolicibacterium smegmatis]|uniref:SMP-30/gluconolactonase/LRE family protein n=1 Tax=Mycolicibacterium smegmatis TaxID=1772 RepID=UPI0005DA0603|nr:SMP-30/gluconolactonase/LRE family protein [Mycolicibacterium smegmatis]MDF1902808.1 SMP-30/gluconolactonase/LRE family protein [Mycolicibacterium smegmatis]MDF1909084.1 SMP-30/gluconolactonase/LRE family protein [Mycolicibacterium smegmatis]MDF1921303.1 SMP-30/gluconolactonase/LRE family protein [Mycolicibacterium smegmatis]MDF1927568.1 SMP-30/gluconolactonase/LRE family protein [Mycolicibacterium smegmatis]UAK55827.1 SMP-30/gluconolactonase/LRE family protein [Mycolicibacterium smegmatis]
MTPALTSAWQPIGPALELGEGARLVDGQLLHVDLLKGRLFSRDVCTGDVHRLAALDIPLGAVAPVDGRAGEFIATLGTGIGFLAKGSVMREGPSFGVDATRVRVNDGACDPGGRFWAGVMAYEPSPEAGALFRIDRDGTITRVVDGLAVPNGPAFSASGTVMYLADSAAGQIYRFDVDEAGHLTGREVFATVDGSPDGMTVDAESHLWTAIWGAGEVHRYAPTGDLVEVIPVPAQQPTSVAIGEGKVFVTSATHGLNQPGPDDGRTFAADCAVEGLPTSAFKPVTGGSSHG